MSTSKLFPFMLKGYASGDANSLEDGIYAVHKGVVVCENLPQNESLGLISVLGAKGYGSGGNPILQTFMGQTGGRYTFYTRGCWASTWSAWQRIDNFGYNTLAELVEGIGVNLNHITVMAASSSANVDSLYTLHNSGMTLLNIAANTAGLPLTATGMLIHFQRSGKGAVSESQQIYQIYLATKRYVRRGVGNGTTIIYSDWSEW